MVIVVNDGAAFDQGDAAALGQVLSPVRFVVLRNDRRCGVAGAWNTGLDFLLRQRFCGFVAVLDDDDAWDPDHLSENRRVAFADSADVVVSGLRMIRDGIAQARELPRNLGPSDFLAGNPGWQGSNTFVSMSLLERVGGFRDGLASLNDRDLAVRLLRVPGVRVAYTGQWTATWYYDRQGNCLSAPRAAAKISGLRWFWHIYGPDMSGVEAEAFFSRADRLFGVRRSEIVDGGHDLPTHRNPYGDLHDAA